MTTTNTDQLKAVRDENGSVKTITFRKNGCWDEQGRRWAVG
jgi:hypothetical protein